MKQTRWRKQMQADLKLIASAIVAGLIVRGSLNAELFTPAAFGKIEARVG